MNILLVEDNPADIKLTQEAFKLNDVHSALNIVMDGHEAMEYLRKQGQYKEAKTPDIVLLDINLPKKNGHTVLAEMKADQTLKSIPVIMLTTSASKNDIIFSYALHANCYITKPVDLKQFVSVVKTIKDFWFTIARLPKK